MALYRNVAVVLTANGRGLTTGLRAATGEVQGFARSVETANAAAAKGTATWTAFKSAALVAAGALAYSVDQALKFDDAMRNVNSLLQVNQTQFKAMEKSVLSISKTTPQGAETLAKGLYDIASSGFAGADALTILKTTAVAATAGVSDTATATKSIVAALNAYGQGADQASNVSDVLFQTVNLGIVSFNELATSLGDVIGSAAISRVSLAEVGSAIAGITLTGVTGAEAVTSLNRLIQQTVKPGKELTQTFHDMGFATGQAAIDALGLHGVIDALRVKFGNDPRGLGAAIRSLYPDIRASRGALHLMAADGKNYDRVFAQIADTTVVAGATQRAYTEQMKSGRNQLKLLGNQANALAIQTGNDLIPAIIAAAHGIEAFGKAAKPTLDGFRPLAEVLVQVAKAAAELGGGALLGVAKGFQVLPAPIQEAVLGLLAFTALRNRFRGMASDSQEVATGFRALTPSARAAATAASNLATYQSELATIDAEAAVATRQLALAQAEQAVAAAKSAVTNQGLNQKLAVYRGTATAAAAASAELGLSQSIAAANTARLALAEEEASLAALQLATAEREAAVSSGFLRTAGSGLLGMLGGPWGIALVAATVGLGIFASKHAAAKQAEDELTQAVISDGNAIGDNTNKWIVNSLTKSGAFEQAKKLGVGIDTLTQAALGSAPAIALMNQELDAWDKANPARGQGDVARIGATDALRQSILGTGTALSDAKQNASDYKTAMDAASGAEINAGKAAAGATPQQAAEAAALKAAAQAADDAAKQTAAYKSALEALNTPLLDARQANRDFEAALDGVHESLKKNGRTLDINTAKGRANQEAIDKGVRAALAQAEANKANGMTMPEVNRQLEISRNRLIRVADGFFHNKKKAREYVDALLKIPPVKKTDVQLDTASAEAKLAALKASLGALDFYAAQKGNFAPIPVPRAPRSGKAPAGVAAGATGGLLSGPGTGTSDSILLRGSDGEFIVNAASTSQNMGVLGFINSGGVVPGFATGGKVTAKQAAAAKKKATQAYYDKVEAGRENARLKIQMAGGGDATLTIAFDSSSAVGGAQDYYDTRAQAAAQLHANMTKNPSDTAEDYFKKTQVTANGFTGVLNKSTAAAKTWGGQLGKIANTVGGDVSSALERMGEQGTAAVAAMARATTKDAQKMADALRALDFAKFTADIGNEAAGRAAFQANLIALVKMGRADLASQLAQMGYEQGGTIAAAAVKASGSSLASLASRIASINNNSDDSLTQTLSLAAAIMGGGGHLGIIGLANATGVDVGDVVTLLASHNSDVFSKLPAGSMAQIRLDQALISAGKQPSGLANSGIVSGANTGMYYRWAEPGSGGESLIAHRPNQRNRAVWAETGRILGMAPSATNTGGSVSIQISAPVSVRVDRAGASADEIGDAVGRAVDSRFRTVVTRLRAGSS